MTIEDTIRDIRKRCRMAMNGIVSANMREYGLNYKLNFGVSLMQIKDIAKRYESDKDLAESIWKEDVRELKILATMLYPLNEFNNNIAEIWVNQIPNQEIREQICLNLLQKLDYAPHLVHKWVCRDSESIRSTGYWLAARLLLGKDTRVETDTAIYPLIYADIESDNISLRNAALLAIKNIGKTSEDTSNIIIGKIKAFENCDNLLKKEIYENLLFEFKYHFENQEHEKR